MLEINLLGAMQVVRDGERPIQFRSQKTLALLAYLVARRRPVARDYLAELLWAGGSTRDPRGQLRRSLHSLSTALPECLVTDRRTAAFAVTPDCRVDIYEFQRVGHAADDSAAGWLLNHCRGVFLEGMYLKDAPDFESWQLWEQERWREECFRALHEQGERYRREGRRQRALSFSQRLLALQPWREEAHRQVMRLLAEAGQFESAARQYERCRHVLQAELGVEPSGETIALFEEISALAGRVTGQSLDGRTKGRKIRHTTIRPDQSATSVVLRRTPSLTEQAKAVLKERILANEFADDRIPAEAELAAELGVSRTTIRDALSRLESEGVIIRRQGAGTFVNRPGLRIKSRLEEIWSYEEVLRDHGYEPSTRILAAELQPADALVAAALDLEPGAPVLFVEKLFLEDAEPVILARNHIPARLVNRPVAPEEFHAPIFQWLADHAGQHLSFYLSEIVPTLATAELSQALHVPAGSALISFEETGYNDENEPIVMATSYFRDELLRLRILRRQVL